MSYQNDNIKAGEITTERTPRGVKFSAFNHERNQFLHIGTLRGTCYEKGSVSILHLPEPSICLSQSELGAALDHGAETLRFITREKISYTIRAELFDRLKEAYYNPAYGGQWRVSLTFFDVKGPGLKRGSAYRNQPQPVQIPMFARPDAYRGGH